MFAVSREKPRSLSVDVSSVTGLASWIPPLGLLCLGGAVLAIASSSSAVSLKDGFEAKGGTGQSRQWWLFLVSLVVILVFSLLFGVTTLRKRLVTESDKFMLSDVSYVAPFGSREISYNHRETDELVFEALTATVSKRFWDYSLRSSGVIDTFSLSKENYDDSIFIHPPFFVYALLLLHCLGVPLVLAPVLFHSLTAALIPPLVLGVVSPLLPLASSSHPSAAVVGRGTRAYTAALWATVAFVTCPIGRLSSQKIWIDNAAAFTTTLAAVAHIFLLRNSRNLSHNSIRRRHMLSGFLFGATALNCKVTSLALLPFMLLWSLLVGWLSHPEAAPSSCLSRKHCRRLLLNVLCCVGGAAAGHGPWVFLYHVSAILCLCVPYEQCFQA